MVGLLGGSIEVDTQLGRGALFRVPVPMPVADPPALPGGAPMPEEHEGLAGLQVLLVEDDPPWRRTGSAS